LTKAILMFLLIHPTIAAAENSKKCPLGQHWVRTYPRKAYVRSDGTFVSAATVSAHCQDNPYGYPNWKTKLAKGRPDNWTSKNERSVKWKEEDRERVLEALGSLPEALWPMKMGAIYRMKKSSRLSSNPASGDHVNIVLYDPAFSGKVPLEEVLAHELAHLKY